jgi:hypothetical protein
MSAKYYIYRNLRIENTFSLRLRGRVVHRLTDFVARNVTFKVNEAGRLRVNAERQKMFMHLSVPPVLRKSPLTHSVCAECPTTLTKAAPLP